MITSKYTYRFDYITVYYQILYHIIVVTFSSNWNLVYRISRISVISNTFRWSRRLRDKRSLLYDANMMQI